MTLVNSQSSHFTTRNTNNSGSYTNVSGKKLSIPKSVAYTYTIRPEKDKTTYGYQIVVSKFFREILFVPFPYYETRIEVTEGQYSYNHKESILLDKNNFQFEQSRLWDLFDDFREESELEAKNQKANTYLEDMKKGFSKAVIRDEKLEKLIN